MAVWKEYAIDPELFANYFLGNEIVSGIGFDRGRIVGAVPKKWLRKVRDICRDNCQPVQFQRLIEQLRSIEAAVLPREIPEDAGNTWLEQVLICHGLRPFGAIVSKSPIEIPSGFDASLGVGGHSLWDDIGSVPIARTADALLEALAPMLAKARKVILVDAYLNPVEVRWLRPIRCLLSSLRRDGGIERLEIHALNRFSRGQYDWTPDVFSRNSMNQFPTVTPQELSIDAYLWKERVGGIEFHERLIVTELGGVAIDPGIDDGAPGQVYRLRLLHRSEIPRYLADFTPQSSPYDLCEMVTCRGGLA